MDKRGSSNNSFHMDTHDLGVVVMINGFIQLKKAADYCPRTSTESTVHRWPAWRVVRLSDHIHASSGNDPDLWPFSVIS